MLRYPLIDPLNLQQNYKNMPIINYNDICEKKNKVTKVTGPFLVPFIFCL